MKILITGAAGFVASRTARAVKEAFEDSSLCGIDNLSRKGSETNLSALEKLGCRFFKGDIGSEQEVATLPAVDWIIDCAANPSVLGGITTGSKQLVSDNLVGTLNLLEKCKRDQAGFLMISTSRVYSIGELRSIPFDESHPMRLAPDLTRPLPAGFGKDGISESFSTRSPLSLYGATKLASEIMALEYASAFDIPVLIDRCSNIAGPGQFGKVDQGIYSYWIYQWLLGRPLSYTGFGGKGKQVRDLLDVNDLAKLVCLQISSPRKDAPKVINVGGGIERAISLQDLSAFCGDVLGIEREVTRNPDTHKFDVPYFVADNSLAARAWGWRPEVKLAATLDSIVIWAKNNIELIKDGF